LKATASNDSDIKCFTHAEVGLSGCRPFRVMNYRWDCPGKNRVPGDDPKACPYSSRALELHNPDGHVFDVPWHTHEFFEFAFVRACKGSEHHTPIESVSISRGDVFVIAPGKSHGITDAHRLFQTGLMLQPQWLTNELSMLWNEPGLIRGLLSSSLYSFPVNEGYWSVRLREEDIAAVEGELDTIVAEACRPAPSMAMYTGCFMKVLSILNRCASDQVTGNLPDPCVWAATQRIEALIENQMPFCVDVIANDVGISKRHLSRLFKISTGYGVSEYFRRRRIQHAKRMLSQPGMSVTQIAHKLNFADTAHFVRVFKQDTGQTPCAFRGLQLQQSPIALPRLSEN
jgi:AraC-like DNA-binding protein